MRWIARGGSIALVLLGALPLASPAGAAEPGAPAAWWHFEDAAPEGLLDGAAEIRDEVSGSFTRVDGVVGRALRLDGFTTVIRRDAARAPRLERAFTLDAWVAIAAYPWNWCPILAQEENGAAGYRFDVGPRGHLRLQAAAGGSWQSLVSGTSLPLRTWTHVAAVYDEDAGMRLYVNGAPAGELETRGPIRPAPEADLLIGMNREKVPPSDAVPPGAGTLPSWFSLDGILDEVRVFDRALPPDAIERYARAATPPPPDIPPRVMPSGPAGPGRFGAYYARLEYYPEWDALWPVADHPDVVVQFDGSPVRVVFWRGLRYSPAWVTENGLWLADQSGESGNDEGCVEHMQDIHNLYSHVRIIESSPARAVVHWRYAPVSGHQHLWTADERTGWPWVMDEYYTFFPDGTGVREVRWREPSADRAFPWLQIQETSVLCHPGQSAEDVLEHEALTLLNLEGRSHTYSWPDDDSPDTRERRNLPVDPSIVRDVEPDDPVIQVVNMRADASPFVIFEPGDEPVVYVGRVRGEVTRFPAYNHWPVSQVRSDGRFAQAADRATSFSISYHTPRRHREEGGVQWVAMLYGATFDEPAALVPLARSWIDPPALVVVAGAAESRGYDVAQRAYVLSCPPDAGCGDLSLELAAGPGSPLANALVIVEGWGEAGVGVRIDGRTAARGEDFRPSLRRTVVGTDLLLWLEVASTAPTRVEIARRD